MKRHQKRHTCLDERQPTIGVGHHPCHMRKAPSGVAGRGHRQIDADSNDSALRHTCSESVPRPGPEVDNHGAVGQLKRCQTIKKCSDERAADSSCVQARPRFDGGGGVACGQRSAVLRLKQIEVPRPRYVVGMSIRAAPGLFVACERQAAVTDGARKRRCDQGKVR